MGFYEIFWVFIGLEDGWRKIKGNVTERLKEGFFTQVWRIFASRILRDLLDDCFDPGIFFAYPKSRCVVGRTAAWLPGHLLPNCLCRHDAD